MDVGAGDQGIMFGYASDETEDCMPLTHSVATKLGKTLTDVRKDGSLWWLRPDGKPQVTIEYKQQVEERSSSIEFVWRSHSLALEPIWQVHHWRPSGRCWSHWLKIIIDTYGGWGAHGGGVFSGKDPTK